MIVEGMVLGAFLILALQGIILCWVNRPRRSIDLKALQKGINQIYSDDYQTLYPKDAQEALRRGWMHYPGPIKNG